jgi:hypothetical protein
MVQSSTSAIWRRDKVIATEKPGANASLEDCKNWAETLRAQGIRPRCSTGIHGCITYGYGNLDDNGFWQYPLEDGEYVG